MTFPAAAGEPPKQLKGFSKTPVLAARGGKASVAFPLNERSFSIWDVETHAWAKVDGEFELHVGSSSSDIRHVAKLNVRSPPWPCMMVVERARGAGRGVGWPAVRGTG